MKRALLCQAVAILFAAGAQATPILPGQTIVAPSEPDPSGGTVVATLTAPFSPGALVGFLDSSVIVGDLSNPFGGLTFTYRLANDAASVEKIWYFTVERFGSFGTDLSYKASIPPNVPPDAAHRSADGEVVGFMFSAGTVPVPFSPGTQSELLVVQTDAVSWGEGSAVVHGNRAAAYMGSLVPVGSKTTIPDASSTLPLLSTSLLAVGLLARRHGKRPGFAEA